MKAPLEMDTHQKNLRIRSRNGLIWYCVIFFATMTAILALATLILNIINGAFGYVAVQDTIMPHTLVAEVRPGLSGNDTELDQLDSVELLALLQKHVRRGRLRAINAEKTISERSQYDLYQLVVDNVVKPRVVKSWTLRESLFNKRSITAWVTKNYPDSTIQFRAWVNFKFLGASLSNTPEKAGLRMPILGSLMIILVTTLFSFPIGVGTAMHLEEFAPDTKLNRLIQVNIYNLSGVPSIIYGLLGLAVFVRLFEPITSGAVFGMSHGGETANGRTILSAGLTLGIADSAHHYNQHPGGYQGRTPESARFGIQPGGNKVAGCVAPCTARFPGQNFHRYNYCHKPGNGRHSSAGGCWGFGFSDKGSIFYL